MKPIDLELPWPPTVNHYYEPNRFGGKRIGTKGRDYRADVMAIVASEVKNPMTGSLRVQIALYPPDRRKRDIDNTMKAMLDAMQHGGAYADDSQISMLEVERREVVPDGTVVVRISQIVAANGKAGN